MTRGQRPSIRKPATKFAHLRKKMDLSKIQANLGKRGKRHPAK
jgi:hypothetical protein